MGFGAVLAGSVEATGAGRDVSMFAGRVFAIFGVGVGFAFAVVPACAADDIEAKAQACAACHGQNGVPTDPKTIPIIWGQQQIAIARLQKR